MRLFEEVTFFYRYVVFTFFTTCRVALFFIIIYPCVVSLVNECELFRVFYMRVYIYGMHMRCFTFKRCEDRQLFLWWSAMCGSRPP